MTAERLGLLGGTFDPPHVAHLQVAQEAVERLALHRILFLVAAQPPHKLGEELSPASIRVEMVRKATEGNPAFEVSEMELEREGPSFTVDTLREIRASHPGAEIFFVLGADQLSEFHEWRAPDTIADLATVVVVARDGAGPEDIPAVELGDGRTLDALSLPVIRMDISSTHIRNRVREGRPIRYLVPPGVEKIIERYRLYRSS